MRKLTTLFTRSTAMPRLTSWLLAIAASTMLSVLPINFDRQFDGFSISMARAAVQQCAAQPQISSGCARASCMLLRHFLPATGLLEVALPPVNAKAKHTGWNINPAAQHVGCDIVPSVA